VLSLFFFNAIINTHYKTLDKQTALNLGYAKATKVLNGRPNRISNEGAIALAAALEVNTTLRALDLTQNVIGDAGIIALAAALQKNATLSHLFLDRNMPLTLAAAYALREALNSNSSLCKVTITCFPFFTFSNVQRTKTNNRMRS
jgi:Ran GTPase-activating protein (RanGAP) involved in mRNA processing and transport